MEQTTSSKKVLNILMVEDNPMDVFLAREILSQSEKYVYQIDTVGNGFEALSYLSRRNNYEKAPRPDLVLLDLNLPRMHGLDTLRKIKENEDLKDMPVFIYTTSTDEDDVEKAIELNADFYLVKPMDLEEFEEAVFDSVS